MLALVLHEDGCRLEDVPIPIPGPGEALVRVEAAGICGRDVPILMGQRPATLPLIPGHEFAGTIVDCGEAISGWQPLDRVAVRPIRSCGECSYCRAGDEALCNQLLELGIHVDGAFAEYVVAPASSLHRLPDELSFEAGAVAAPLAYAYHGARMAGIGSHETVAIIGSGPIGLYAMQCAFAMGAQRVVLVGRGPERLRLAATLKPDLLVDVAASNPRADVYGLTGGRMAEVVIEAVGTPEALNTAIDCAARGGRLVVLGDYQEPVMIDLSMAARKELTLKTSFRYSWHDFESALGLLRDGRVVYEALVTHRYPLRQFAEALARLSSRAALKVLLIPHEPGTG